VTSSWPTRSSACARPSSAFDDVEHRRRAIALANEIADEVALNDMKELAPSPQLCRRVRLNLTSRTFYDKRYCRPLLRFLSDLLGEGMLGRPRHRRACPPAPPAQGL
jgi:hypothetical protein